MAELDEAKLELFARGILAHISTWTAFQIGLEIAGRTDESPLEISARLAEEIVDAYMSAGLNQSPSALDDFLREFVEVELDTLLEDDSEQALVSQFNALWRLCCGQDLTAAKTVVSDLEARASTRKGKATEHATKGELQEGESSSDDDDSESEDDSMDIDDSASSKPTREPVQIDEDGFQTVTHKSRRR